jgi:UPF0755 protein
MAVLGATCAVAVFVGGYALLGDRSRPAQPQTVVIARGMPFGEIAATLGEQGVVAHPLGLRLLAKLRGVESRVEAGEYAFPAHESPGEVLDRLVEGRGQIARWITIPEGFTAREIAAALQARGLGPAREYDAWFLGNSIELYGTRTVNLEGFLFPDTYLIPMPATPEVTARIMVDEFRRRLPADAQARARALHLSVPQVIAVASLVEREAKADDERPLMAGVYYNRLRLHMPLQVDASIEYALPSHATEITSRDLAIDSPFNTYRHDGLPPTPIANPGSPSIQAAFHPQASGYLYYVYKGDGHHAFARTYAEHSANVARYLR